MSAVKLLFAGAALIALAGCGERAKLPVSAGMGPAPVLPEPNRTLLPTVKVAAFADRLDHLRWLYVLPNGPLLVADDVGNTIWRLTPAR